MQGVIIFFYNEKFEYVWRYSEESFLGFLPAIGDFIELGFDVKGEPAYANVTAYISFKVLSRTVKPGQYWWIEVEGEVPDFESPKG